MPELARSVKVLLAFKSKWQDDPFNSGVLWSKKHRSDWAQCFRAFMDVERSSLDSSTREPYEQIILAKFSVLRFGLGIPGASRSSTNEFRAFQHESHNNCSIWRLIHLFSCLDKWSLCLARQWQRWHWSFYLFLHGQRLVHPRQQPVSA